MKSQTNQENCRIEEFHADDHAQVSGGFLVAPGKPLQPVKPPVYYTQAIGEDGNYPPEYLW